MSNQGFNKAEFRRGLGLEEMTRIETAAIWFHRLLWENTGHTDEWPINLKVDEEIHHEVVNAFNELHDAIEERLPGSAPWPIRRITP